MAGTSCVSHTDPGLEPHLPRDLRLHRRLRHRLHGTCEVALLPRLLRWLVRLVIEGNYPFLPCGSKCRYYKCAAKETFPTSSAGNEQLQQILSFGPFGSQRHRFWLTMFGGLRRISNPSADLAPFWNMSELVAQLVARVGGWANTCVQSARRRCT